MKAAFTWGGVAAALSAVLLAASDPTPEKIGLAVLAVYNLFVNPPTPKALGIRAG